MATIFHKVLIQADAHIIYDAITTQKGLSSWWIEDCDAKAETGYVNTFSIEGYDSTKMKIKKLSPDKKVVWKCVAGDKEWKGTKLTFTISKDENASILKFKHAKWKKQSDFYATCNFHWARHLLILKNYCEKGQSALDPVKEKEEVKKVRKAKVAKSVKPS
jgi:uncharacterized protein YndB with AHSA1/START domain